MRKLQIVCYIIGVSQIVLGALYLLAPADFIAWQGLLPIAQDISYPMAMFSARLLVYGIGMFVIARQPTENRFWLDGMIAIQAIDLLAGIFYTASGVVTIGSSATPMINASLFIILLSSLRAHARPVKIDA